MSILIEAVMAALMFSADATGSVVPSDGLLGQWGGDHVRLSVTAHHGQMTLDCGSGTFEVPSRLDRTGAFRVDGTLEAFALGPTRLSETRMLSKAIYEGHLVGDRLTLRVTTATPPNSQRYSLVRDSRVKLVRCL